MAVNEGMTPGVLKALNKGRNRTNCECCGFPLPVYPGRYPKNCPHCDKPLVKKEGNGEQQPG